MPLTTPFTARFHLACPVIQAPLAGGGDTPELVAAVCKAGGMGFIGAAYLSPARIAASAAEVRRRTGRAFGINLFAPSPEPEPPANAQRALEFVAPYFAELGLAPPSFPKPEVASFGEQLDATLESGASAFSFTFGLLSPADIERLHSRGMYVMGTATSVDEAVALADAGVDAVVAQGSEAGGHRGTFLTGFDSAMVGTLALTPQIADAVRIPVIASGGIMDGRGIAAVLALGADAAQMGTAFLMCRESGISGAYRAAIRNARETDTRVTRAFSGRVARGIVNRFMTEVETAGAILPFPLQNALTRPLRTEAAKQNRAEFLSLWAGQGVRMAKSETASELIARLCDEAESVIARLNSSCQ
ncbi:MAG TPA: nitronate monooxygenase [Bryobacteraceae bacterium]|nr:nitronate monooxygenase [Bryobacteraceae bacterium]